MRIPSLPFSYHTPNREFVMKKCNFSQHMRPDTVLIYSTCEPEVPLRGKWKHYTLLLYLYRTAPGSTNPPVPGMLPDSAGDWHPLLKPLGQSLLLRCWKCGEV